MAEGFKYPGDHRTSAKIRRGTLALICAILMVVLWELIKNTFPDNPVINYLKKNNHNIDNLTLYIGTFSWIYFSNLSKSLDFLFFPYFDTSKFDRIVQHTGLLVWSHKEDSKQMKAWNQLQDWLKADLGDGRWKLSWLFSGKVDFQPDDKDSFKQFDFAILLGSNGIGKSQLARELGRHLAQRKRFGSSHKQTSSLAQFQDNFKCTLRRVYPLSKVFDEDPWDAAIINLEKGTPENLKDWRPGKRTLLVLDDPALANAKPYIDVFQNQKVNYFYPVRLIILDQFLPADLNIKPNLVSDSSYQFAYNSNPITVVQMGNIIWDENDYRAANASGRWVKLKAIGGYKKECFQKQSLNFVTELAVSDRLKQLCDAFEGNPYLLSLVSHWLAECPRLINPNQMQYSEPKRTVQRLLSQKLEINTNRLIKEIENEIQTQGVYLLLSERVNELMTAYEAIEKSLQYNTVIRTIAKAAIAGKIKNPYEPLVAKQFTTLIGDYIYTPGPWPLCEYLVKAWYDNKIVVSNNSPLSPAQQKDASLDKLIFEAFDENPFGLIKAFNKKGWLADYISNLLSKNSATYSIEKQINFLHAAMLRSLYVTPSVTTIAVSMISKLEDNQIDQAWEKFSILAESNLYHDLYPNYLTRATLAFSLATRRLALLKLDNVSSDNICYIAIALNPYLYAINYDLSYVPSKILQPLKAACQQWFSHLLFTIGRITDKTEMHNIAETIRLNLRVNSETIQDALGKALFEHADLLRQSNQESTFHLEMQFWGMMAYPSLEGYEAITKNIENSAEYQSGSEVLKAKLAWAWQLVGFARSTIPEERNKTLEVITHIEKVAEYKTKNTVVYTRINEALALAWMSFDLARVKNPKESSETIDVINQIEKIAIRCPESVKVQEALAIASLNVALCSSSNLKVSDLRDDEKTIKVISYIEKIAERCSKSIILQECFAKSLGILVEVLSKYNDKSEQSVEVIARLEKIAKHHRDFPEIQLSLATAWTSIACARSNSTDERDKTIESIAHIEEVAKYTLGYMEIYEQLAEAWSFVGFARALSPTEADKAIEVIAHIEKIAGRFPESVKIQEFLAYSWQSIGYVRSKNPNQLNETVEVISLIEKIAIGCPESIKIQECLASAYTSVGFARSHNLNERHKAIEVIRHIEKIAGRFPESEKIQEALAFSWLNTGYVRAKVPEERIKTIETISQIEKIAQLFPKSAKIHEALAKTWYYVALADSQLKLTSQLKINEIYKRFPHPAISNIICELQLLGMPTRTSLN